MKKVWQTSECGAPLLGDPIASVAAIYTSTLWGFGNRIALTETCCYATMDESDLTIQQEAVLRRLDLRVAAACSMMLQHASCILMRIRSP